MAIDRTGHKLDIYEAERRLTMQIEQLTNAVIRGRGKGVTQNIKDIRRDVSAYQKALLKFINAK